MATESKQGTSKTTRSKKSVPRTASNSVSQKKKLNTTTGSGDSKKGPATKKSSSQSKSKSKTPAKKSKALPKKTSKLYTLAGDLLISTAGITISSKRKGPVKTPELYIDEEGRAFNRAPINVDEDGVVRIVLLEGEQVELLLKLMGLVGDAK